MRWLLRWFLARYLRRNPAIAVAYVQRVNDDLERDAAKAMARVRQRQWWCEYRDIDWATDPEFHAAHARHKAIIERYKSLLAWLETICPTTEEEGA